MGKITELPVYPEHKEAFTCKRCGCHLGKDVAVTTHKFGCSGLGYPTVHVCGNCLNGTNLQF